MKNVKRVLSFVLALIMIAGILPVTVFEASAAEADKGAVVDGTVIISDLHIGTENVVVYYKNSSADMLYGGITYRVMVSGGIQAGEIKQITGGHISAHGSRVMWVTVG